ncbi:unnamed protein product [Brassicogethes aeneus]|uniref:DNA-directed RNA polymerase I subunit RPA43 n=1 Tax=Brassicogethes aeneus TaxID=1431903 RepID=A0A9P0FAL6_BRAAE|nr:unnamed protein product [Brassicogethes aeneus]
MAIKTSQMGAKQKFGISFDKKLLNQLKDNECSCVEVHQKTQHLALHPLQLENLNNSIKDTLNKGIARYNKKLEGILLGYQHIKLCGDTGAINFDSCFVHIDIQADFYLFKPNVDRILSGIVNKKSTDHVGVLVYSAFNVSLPKPADAEDWLGERVQIGSEVTFRVSFTDFESRLPYIRGEIISITENDSGISTSEEGGDKKKKNTKKKFNDKDNDEDTLKSPKKISFESSIIEETPKLKKKKRSSFSESDKEFKVPSPKKKRKKDMDNSLDELQKSMLQEQMSLLGSMNKKSKKSKKSKEEMDEVATKKEKKKKNKKNKDKKSKEDDEISLPDLNLNELFSRDISKSASKVDMADSQDKTIKKRHSSTSQLSYSFNLPSNSDLDESLKEESSKLKRKRSLSESFSPSKKKKKNFIKE